MKDEKKTTFVKMNQMAVTSPKPVQYWLQVTFQKEEFLAFLGVFEFEMQF